VLEDPSDMLNCTVKHLPLNFFVRKPQLFEAICYKIISLLKHCFS